MPGPKNRFRDQSLPMKVRTVLTPVLLIWVILLTSAVSEAFSNVDNSIRETVEKLSLDPENNKFSEANFGFGFDLGFGWLGTLADYIWSPGGGIAIGVALVYFLPKLRQSIKARRRTRRPAPASSTSNS